MPVSHVCVSPSASEPEAVGLTPPPGLKAALPSTYCQLAGRTSVTVRFLAATLELFLTTTRQVNGWPTSELALAGNPSAPVVFSIVIAGSVTLAETCAEGPAYSR